MKVEVLASVMNQTEHSILKKMNIQTNAIVVNQCNINNIEEVKYNNCNIKFLSFSEKGVGLSRNNALMRAKEEIVIFADEDMTYVNNYEKIIIDEFKKNPSADMILFNVPSLNDNRPTVKINKFKRIHKFNCLKYGAVNIAVRLTTIKKYNLYFSLLFGGGAKYSSGEDSLFIYNFLKLGGKVYSSPLIIGYVEQKDSTWFKGYNEKYFFDIGVFYYILSKKLAWFYCAQFLIRHYDKSKSIGFFNAIKYMRKGIKEIKYE